MQDQFCRRKMEQLLSAIRDKDLPSIRQILSHPSAKQIVNSYDQNKQTPLFHAGLHPDQDFGIEIVDMLLKAGADPYHKEDNQQTIVYWLASENKQKILAKMLELGYSLNQKDAYGQTPIFFAAVKGRLKCAQMLIKNGSNVNHLDNNGQTCLFFAAREGHLQMCKQLINRGCDPLVVDNYKKTAIFYARQRHHTQVAEYLSYFKKEKKNKQNSESLQLEKKGKKKETSKNDYLLVFTNEQGNTRPVDQQQLKEFLSSNEKIKQLMQNPQKLQEKVIEEDKIFQVGNKILGNLLKSKDTILFHQPVRWEEMGLLDYPNFVSQPMDYSTMRHKLNYNCYKSEEDFTKDMHLVYDNCIVYNGAESVYGKLAEKLKEEYDTIHVEEFRV